VSTKHTSWIVFWVVAGRYVGLVAVKIVQQTLTSIAANIRRIRLRQDLTQEQLAEQAGLEPRTIQHIETGKANPTVGLLVTIAAALGVSATTLLRTAKLRSRPVGRPRRQRATR
jgi:DNA-binding XRE family transcriptional regulator